MARPGIPAGPESFEGDELLAGTAQTPHEVHADREEIEVGGVVGDEVIASVDTPPHVAGAGEVHSATEVEAELAVRRAGVSRRARKLGAHVVDADASLGIRTHAALGGEIHDRVHGGLESVVAELGARAEQCFRGSVGVRRATPRVVADIAANAPLVVHHVRARGTDVPAGRRGVTEVAGRNARTTAEADPVGAGVAGAPTEHKDRDSENHCLGPHSTLLLEKGVYPPRSNPTVGVASKVFGIRTRGPSLYLTPP